MDRVRDRALVLLGACLASRSVRQHVDATRIVDTEVGAALQALAAVDAGTKEADALDAVDSVLEGIGVRRQAAEGRVDAIVAAVREDWKARVRRRLLHMTVAPKLFPVAPGTLRKIVEEENL